MKKIINLVLMFAMCLNMFTANAETKNNFEYEKTYTKLKRLGLLSNDIDYSNEKAEVKRVDFVISALNLINKESNEAVTENVFKDVDKNHYAAGYIKKGVSLGFLSGYSDGTFMPQNPINMNQAIKIVVRILGYGEVAEAYGGYPKGYISVADDKQLLKGINNSGNEVLTYADMLRLFDNALETEIMSLEFKGENVSFEEKENCNLLSVYHDIYYEEGIVNANDVTALLKYSEVVEGNVNISGVEYSIGSSDISSKLGYAVNFYYKQDKDDVIGEVLYFEESDKNYVITVNYDDIIKTSDSFSFKYYDERERKQEETITAYTNILVNGKLKPFYDEKDLMPEYGQVVLIDNDNDDEFEVIDVFSVTDTMIVNNISEKDGIISITDMLVPEKIITLDEELGYIILKDNVEILHTDLAEWNTILVGKADDGYLELHISDESVSGKVTGLSENNKVIIEGKEYIISQNYLDVSDKRINISKIKIGINSTFYLDSFGSIAAMPQLDNVVRYGFLFKIYTDEENENKIRLRMLTDGNEIKVFETAEKIKLNGKTVEGDAVKLMLESSNAKDEGRKQGSIRQLISYTENEDGLIKSINTVDATEDFRYEGSLTSDNYYDYYLGTWNRKYWEDADTKTFCIYDEDDECQVVSKFSDVLTEQTSNYTVYFYNQDNSLRVDAVIRYFDGASAGSSADVNADNLLIMAEKIIKGLDEDDNAVKIVEGYDVKGQKHSVFASDTTNKYVAQVFDTIIPGDVFVYSTSNTGNLNGLFKIFDSKQSGKYGSIGLGALREGKQVNGLIEYRTVNSQRATIYAKVLYIEDGNVVYEIEPGDERMIQLGNTPIASIDIINTNKAKITTGLSVADILPGSDILISARYNQVKGAVVINKK